MSNQNHPLVLLAVIFMYLFSPKFLGQTQSDRTATFQSYSNASSEWVKLGVVRAIMRTVEEQKAKSVRGFIKFLGLSYGTFLRVGGGGRNIIEIYANKGRRWEAEDAVLKVAREKGYLIDFDDLKFDPTKSGT